MADPIAASRLPDLPNAGYATKAQKELTDAVMFLIRGIERDRLFLLEVVLQGKWLWRKRFVHEFKAIKADDDLADAVFGYLVLLAGPNPEAQQAILEGQMRQQAVEAYDKRLATKLKGAKNYREILEDIKRESLKPRKVYFGG